MFAMSLIVQKYGGTSVANPESLKIVADKIISAKKENHQVVVVVSAMGSSTDELITLASQLSDEPSPREMDMLLSAGERITMSLLAMHLNSLCYDSFSLTGSQAGIITTSRHGRAEIGAIMTAVAALLMISVVAMVIISIKNSSQNRLISAANKEIFDEITSLKPVV